MVQPKLKLYGIGPRALKCEIVASFADINLVHAPFTKGITNKTERYLAMNPQGKVTASFSTPCEQNQDIASDGRSMLLECDADQVSHDVVYRSRAG